MVVPGRPAASFSAVWLRACSTLRAATPVIRRGGTIAMEQVRKPSRAKRMK